MAAASDDPAEAARGAKALDLHNSAVEAYADGLVLQIGRICRAAVAIGVAPGVSCASP